MVNNQTSQYELLNNTFYLSPLGIFQYVRDILQNSLPADHPVCVFVNEVFCTTVVMCLVVTKVCYTTVVLCLFVSEVFYTTVVKC